MWRLMEQLKGVLFNNWASWRTVLKNSDNINKSRSEFKQLNPEMRMVMSRSIRMSSEGH